MLKIGSIRWKGRCSRHPGFDPETEGPGAVRGGCQRCQMLFEIWENHSKMVRLMRQFGNREEAVKPKGPVEDDRQLSLLD